MQVHINPGTAAHVSKALSDFLQEELGKVEKRFGDSVTRLEAYYADVNGPKGGADNKQCRLEARPKGMDPLTAEARSESAYDATKEAVDRLEKVLDKHFGRQEAARH